MLDVSPSLSSSSDAYAQSTPDTAAPHLPGLVEGTEILTLKGIQTVESLKCGDKIVTRSGARPLQALRHTGPFYHLEFDRPQVVLMPEGQIYSDTCRAYVH